MRKIVFWLMLAILCLCLMQAGAETTVTLEPVSGAVTFNDNYIVLEPGTLSEHPELLSSIGTTQAEAEADWAARGVLAQAWTADRSICVEITAVQDEEAKQYFDVEQQFARVKKEYRSLHLKDSRFNSETYDVKSADWKQQATGIHLLILKYKALRGGAYRLPCRSPMLAATEVANLAKRPENRDLEKLYACVVSGVIGHMTGI